jgi:hypothetical protein
MRNPYRFSVLGTSSLKSSALHDLQKNRLLQQAYQYVPLDDKIDNHNLIVTELLRHKVGDLVLPQAALMSPNLTSIAIKALQARLRVVDEVPSEPVGETYYQLVNASVIDTYHGKITYEDFLKDAAGFSYRVVVKFDGVTKVEQDPHYGTGGDYTIDYATGRITPLTWARGAGVVLVTYHYARTSKFWLRPSAGKKLLIESVECQFSANIVLTDTAVFQPKGLASAFAPQLGLPEGTKIPLGNALKYKTMRDFMNDTMKSYPGYPPLGGNTWRGLGQAVHIFDWDYTRTTDLMASSGMEIEVRLEHDVPYGGEYATVTFYCVSDDE